MFSAVKIGFHRFDVGGEGAIGRHGPSCAKNRSVFVATVGNCAPMISMAPNEDDAVGVSFHPCSSCIFVGLLCPILRGEETKLEVGDMHAVCNLDLMHCAFVSSMLNMKVPCPSMARPPSIGVVHTNVGQKLAFCYP